MLGLWAKSYAGEAADGTKMLSVSRAKGKTGLDRCGSDRRVGYLNAVGDRMQFDEGGGRGP